MRYLFVNYEYPPLGAGAGLAMKAIARQMVDQGHSVTILTSAFGGNEGASEEDGISIYRVPARRKHVERSNILQMVCFIFSAIWNLPKVLKGGPYDISVAFFSIPSGPISLWLKTFYKIPYMVSLRGGDVPGTHPELNWIHTLLTPLRRRILMGAKRVLANSDGLKAQAEKADPIHVEVVPNGIDSEFFAPKEWPTSPPLKKQKILVLGRIQKQKNLPFLIEQFKVLKDSSALGPFEVHLVGDGPDSALLAPLIKEAGLSDLVVWDKWIHGREKIRALLQSADVFVSASLGEGMPNALLEAMSTALPVLVSRVPGHVDLVEDGESGLLFDLKDGGSDFRRKIELLLNHQAYAKTLGTQARERVRNHHSWSMVSREYSSVLSYEDRPSYVSN